MILFIHLNKYLTAELYRVFLIEYFIHSLDVIADYLLKIFCPDHLSMECYQESSEKRSVFWEKQLIEKDSISNFFFLFEIERSIKFSIEWLSRHLLLHPRWCKLFSYKLWHQHQKYKKFCTSFLFKTEFIFCKSVNLEQINLLIYLFLTTR